MIIWSLRSCQPVIRPESSQDWREIEAEREFGDATWYATEMLRTDIFPEAAKAMNLSEMERLSNSMKRENWRKRKKRLEKW